MFTLYGETFPSRLLLGTAAYPTPEILKQSVQIAQPAMITVSLRRAGSGGEAHGQGFWSLLEEMGVPVLPNTAGCQSVQEAVTTAQMRAKCLIPIGLSSNLSAMMTRCSPTCSNWSRRRKS